MSNWTASNLRISDWSETEPSKEAFDSAAELIKEACIMLVVAGAGMSADSGLPVYDDVANCEAYENLGLSYADLCTERMLHSSPAQFYGFWGHCLSLYRMTEPHQGYSILHRLCEGKEHFIYSTNVDSHFLGSGFRRDRVFEVHGSIERWVTLPMQAGEEKDPQPTFTPPPSFHFTVDEDTRRSAECEPTVDAGVIWKDTPCLKEDHTRVLRPAVLMFGDERSTYEQLGLHHASDAYQEWEEAMEALLEADPAKKMVILELGCGVNVPSARIESEEVLRDAMERAPNQISLIRVNPDFPLNPRQPESTIPLKTGALNALQRIEKVLSVKKEEEFSVSFEGHRPQEA